MFVCLFVYHSCKTFLFAGRPRKETNIKIEKAEKDESPVKEEVKPKRKYAIGRAKATTKMGRNGIYSNDQLHSIVRSPPHPGRERVLSAALEKNCPLKEDENAAVFWATGNQLPSWMSQKIKEAINERSSNLIRKGKGQTIGSVSSHCKIFSEISFPSPTDCPIAGFKQYKAFFRTMVSEYTRDLKIAHGIKLKTGRKPTKPKSVQKMKEKIQQEKKMTQLKEDNAKLKNRVNCFEASLQNKSPVSFPQVFLYFHPYIIIYV